MGATETIAHDGLSTPTTRTFRPTPSASPTSPASTCWASSWPGRCSRWARSSRNTSTTRARCPRPPCCPAAARPPWPTRPWPTAPWATPWTTTTSAASATRRSPSSRPCWPSASRPAPRAATCWRPTSSAARWAGPAAHHQVQADGPGVPQHRRHRAPGLRRRLRQAAQAGRGADGHRPGHRRVHGLGPDPQLRHHDQAPARRPHRARRRDRRAVGPGRV